LQAYALTKLLNNMGHDAEQISFIFSGAISHDTAVLSHSYTSPYRLIQKIRRKFNQKWNPIRAIPRDGKCFQSFVNMIPHTEKEFNYSSIIHTIHDYDAFITGSDQVWNFNYFVRAFFLEFVPQNKLKIAYAASAATAKFDKKQKNILRENLNTFDAFSVRESNTAKAIQKILKKECACTLDPTLMLKAQEWDEIAAPRLIDKDYVFCYFLGANSNIRSLAIQYTQEHNLTLVSIPILEVDNAFGDLRLDASVEEFLSLIKHANCVFTDSFHGCAFSCIFKKDFHAFGRSGAQKKMNARIQTLVSMFGLKDRYYKGTVKYTKLAKNKIDYLNLSFEQYTLAKKKSLIFLQNALAVSKNPC